MDLIKVLGVVLLSLFSYSIEAQSNESRIGLSGINLYDQQPFERAVMCIKFYEGWHTSRDYPYIGYGHQIQPGERLSYSLSLKQADALLRSDLKSMCALFRNYGKDSLLLATLAYNVGPYRIIGNGKIPKSNLLKKIEAGSKDFVSEYVNFCHYKGKKVASIERRRWAELLLLYYQ